MSFLPKFKKVALVSRVPQVARVFLLFAICYLLFAIFAPARASAVSRWGPHLVCYSSAEMMARVRDAYNNAGTGDWIPATIILTSDMDANSISQILANAFQYQIIPIFRLEGPGFSGPLTPDEARKAAGEISVAVAAGPSFPRQIYVEVGNEPNLWDIWGSGDSRVTNYNNVLSAFLDAARGIGVLNGALDLSNPSDGNMLDAKEFWDKFPNTTIRRVSGTAHNPYHGVGAPPVGPPYPSNIRGTIDAWRWEKDVMAGKGAGGPTFLLEFGFNPSASEREREAFLEGEFWANRHPVEAITPLFMLGPGAFKIVIFGPRTKGGADLIDPIGGASCGAGPGAEIDTRLSLAYGEDVLLSNTAVGEVIPAPTPIPKGQKPKPTPTPSRRIYVPNPLDLSKLEIGVLEGENFKFPDLLSFTSLASRALPHQLPKIFSDSLSLPEMVLEGAIFHPICNVWSTEGNPKSLKVRDATGSSKFKTPSYWTKMLGATQIGRALGVPGFSSTSTLTATQPTLPGDEENRLLSSCPQPPGPPSTVLATNSREYTILDIPGWLGQIIQFFQDIWQAFTQPRTGEVAVVVKPKRFLPGEEAFINQTSADLGMLKSVCPASLCKGPDPEKDKSRYKVGGNVLDPGIGLEFKAFCGTRGGFNLLIDSLFPYGFPVQKQPNCP